MSSGEKHQEGLPAALSRGDLLRRWQEERKRTFKKNPRSLSPKKVKVRVRRSHPTPDSTSAGIRLHQQGTVASRLKSKSYKYPHRQQQQPTTTTDENRRKSEPYKIPKGANNPHIRTRGNCLINLVITGEAQVPLSPLSCSCPSMILGSLSPLDLPQHDQYSSHDVELTRLHGCEYGESLSMDSVLSEQRFEDFIYDNDEGQDGSQNLVNITNRSKSQHSLRYDYQDVLGFEDWSQLGSPGSIELPRSPSQRAVDFSFNGNLKQNQLDVNLYPRQLTHDREQETCELQDPGLPSMPRSSLSRRKESVAVYSRHEDDDAGNETTIGHTSHGVDVPSDTSEQSREACPNLTEPIIWENQRCLDREPDEWENEGSMSEKNKNEGTHAAAENPGHDLDDDSFDWRKNESPNTPLQQRSIVNHSRRRISMPISNENVLNGATPYSDASKPSPLDKTKEHTGYDKDVDDDSFDWRQNFSPDTPPLQGSKSNHGRRLHEYILISPRSPLDRFRDDGSPQSDPGSLSLDSDQAFDQNHEFNGRQNQQSPSILGISANTQWEDSSLGDKNHDSDSQEGLVFDTVLQMNGRTILEPLREEQETSLALDSDYEEEKCACPCCTLHDAKSKRLKSLVRQLRWRAETAEAEKHKCQNQIYTIRKQVDTRITPFRDVFDEMFKLKQLNQRLLKENQETKATLDCCVSDLQKQMTEALTTVLQKNETLKAQLQDAESHIEELRLGMD